MNQIYVESTRDRTKDLMISKIDIGYSIRQVELSKAGQNVVFALTGWWPTYQTLPIQKRILRSCRHPNDILKNNLTKYSTPAWLDDLIVVPRGDRAEYEKKSLRSAKKKKMRVTSKRKII